MEIDAFNISSVIEHFESSLVGNTDVNLISYLNAFEELSRLFSVLGMVFSFVEMDVTEKRGILHDLYNKNEKDYATVEKMVFYECFELKNDTIPQKIEPKNLGSRTFLRLHRALAFLIKFIEGIQSNESIVNHFQSAYRETLANHHTWFVRKSVGIASHTIPNKSYLLNAFFGEEKLRNEKHVKMLSENFLSVLKNVYNRVQKIYVDKDLLNLP